MQMIRQHDPAVNVKWMPMPHHRDSVTQLFDMRDEKIVAMPSQQVNGKEIGSTRMSGAAIIGHDESMFRD
jgi:hypothetical protein